MRRSTQVACRAPQSILTSPSHGSRRTLNFGVPCLTLVLLNYNLNANLRERLRPSIEVAPCAPISLRSKRALHKTLVSVMFVLLRTDHRMACFHRGENAGKSFDSPKLCIQVRQ